MKVLVTGAKGFVGRNLVENLKCIKDGRNKTRNITIEDIFEYDIDTQKSELESYCKECDFVFNLAGINRPKDNEEFNINHSFLAELLNLLKENDNKCPVMLSSSTQALLDNDYGKSKKEAEDLLIKYGKENDVKTFVYRFPNVFGKWSRPNYNSAVATFCNNIAAGLPIKVNDPSVIMKLVYIDDVVDEFISAMNGKANIVGGFGTVPVEHTVELGRIAELIYSFKDQRENFTVPDFSNEFEKKLYSTYLSFLPKDSFAYSLNVNSDSRGSFTEFIRTTDRGQVSINVAKPGITKGNHWHHTKNEKFLVVSGEADICFRKVGETEVITYHVTGDDMKVVDIPCGYTHNIKNVGDTELVTVMWANEQFDKNHPDTFAEKDHV